MNVKDLKDHLQQYPDEMEIITRIYSDYQILSVEGVDMIKAVDKGYYVMQTHETMSEDNKLKEKQYIVIGDY